MTPTTDDPLRSYSAAAFQQVVGTLGEILTSVFDGLLIFESPALNHCYLLLVKRARELGEYLEETQENLEEFLERFPNLYEAIGDADSPDEKWEFGGDAILRGLKARAADTYVEFAVPGTQEKLEDSDAALIATAKDVLRNYRDEKDERTRRWLKRAESQAESIKARIPSNASSDAGEAARSVSTSPSKGLPSAKTIFVVHGRNELARKAVFDFLRSLGLEPLEWIQAVAATGKATPYIGDVLDAAFSIAQAVVVVLTGDDLARLRPELCSTSEPAHELEFTPQARPNVLFEAGIAMGRFGDRTVIVEIGELRPFSDTGGRFTLRLNDSSQRRQEFAERLRSAGCDVDTSGTDWHTTGDFSALL